MRGTEGERGAVDGGGGGEALTVLHREEVWYCMRGLRPTSPSTTTQARGIGAEWDLSSAVWAGQQSDHRWLRSREGPAPTQFVEKATLAVSAIMMRMGVLGDRAEHKAHRIPVVISLVPGLDKVLHLKFLKNRRPPTLPPAPVPQLVSHRHASARNFKAEDSNINSNNTLLRAPIAHTKHPATPTAPAMPVPTPPSDDDIPLAKRKRVLQGGRGAAAPSPRCPRAASPEVVELLDDSDDPDAPAYAPESSGPSPPSDRAGGGAEGPSPPTRPVEVSEVEEIEVGLTSDDDADVIVIDDDSDEPAAGEQEAEGPRSSGGATLKRKEPPRQQAPAATAGAKPAPARLPSLHDPGHPLGPAKRGASGAPAARGSPPRPAPAQRAPRPPAAGLSTAAPPPRAPRGPALDDPYAFSNPVAGGEFRRAFGKPPRASPGMSQAALERRAREILHDMTRPARQAMQKSKVAWNAAAMLWREKNKPSAAELEQRAAEDAARISTGRPRLTPRDHATRASSSGDEGGAPAPPPRPAPDAPETEWRAFYRHVAQDKLAGAPGFAGALRVFGVPCDDSSRGLKDAYRLAVRMFHPDSNSRERAWATPTEKMQAEEVMKIINERREQDGF